MAAPEPVKMEVQKPAGKGENPSDSFEERLISLLITVLTRVIHILLTEASTLDFVRKLLGGKGKR